MNETASTPTVRNFTCPKCIRGCYMEITGEAGRTLEVYGNACPKGAAFARAEILDPRRTLTTSVATAFPDTPRLRVRIENVPEPRVLDAMMAIDAVTAERRLEVGDVLAEDFLGLGLRIVALGKL